MMLDFLIMGMVALSGLLLLPGRIIKKPVPKIETETDSNDFSQDDLDTLARTIWGEARGEGKSGMQAVANVVMNRYKLSQGSMAKARQFGRTVSEICRKPHQFSVWNISDPNFSKMMTVTRNDPSFRLAIEIARKALEGNLKDITNGADHYHTAQVNPSWSKGEKPVAVINSHKFFRLA